MKAVKSVARALSEGNLDESVIRENYDLITNHKIKKLKNPVEPFSLDKAKAIIGRKEHKEFAQAVAEQDKEKLLKKE